MGCDIHGRVQRRYSETGKYADIGPMEDDRNYKVFAMLAGVRNGFGFAGVATHSRLVPVSEPRGLPADLELIDGDSVKLHRYNDDDELVEYGEWLGDHSHSWLSLSEILAWDGWNMTLQMTGILSAEEFARVEREGDKPRAWSGGVWGLNVTQVTAEQARAGEPHTHVAYEWTEPFAACITTFKKWLDYMASKYGWLIEKDPQAIRLVFGFDS